MTNAAASLTTVLRRVRRRDDWVKVIEGLLRDACRTERLLRMRGLKPDGLRSAAPIPVRGLHEAYGYDRAEPGAPFPSSAAISRWDYALDLVAGANLTALQRGLVWDRARRRGWKQIAVNYGEPGRSLQRSYAAALRKLCIHAALQAQRQRSLLIQRKYSGDAAVSADRARASAGGRNDARAGDP